MKKKFYLCLLIAMALPSFSIQVQADPVDLSVGYTDPSDPIKHGQRGPIFVPKVDINDYTLTFVTPCDGSILRLVDDSGDVVYTTVITNGAPTFVLPSYLSGKYEIQIVRGSFYFYGHIIL